MGSPTKATSPILRLTTKSLAIAGPSTAGFDWMIKSSFVSETDRLPIDRLPIDPTVAQLGAPLLPNVTNSRRRS
jgi:hypothetical protein